MKVTCLERIWRMNEPFVISRGARAEQETLLVQVEHDGLRGQGEACGVPYAGETPATMTAQISEIVSRLEGAPDREALLGLLPPGGARMALDTAIWDWEAKAAGVDPFRALGVDAGPVTTAYTIGIRATPAYEATARERSAYQLLKVKVGKEEPFAALDAVHRGAPNAALIVDPNQAWCVDQLVAWGPRLAEFGVVLLEQPIAVGAEKTLSGYRSPIPLCADELINDDRDLEKAAGLFDYVNIKLDKCGGLTAAWRLADAATAAGFGLMVGCMAGSSLCMAPAMVLAQRCKFVDLDGPLLQEQDCTPAFHYEAGVVRATHIRGLWG